MFIIPSSCYKVISVFLFYTPNLLKQNVFWELTFCTGRYIFHSPYFYLHFVTNQYFFKADPIAASYMINVLKMKALIVKQILDHSDMKITERHYVRLNLKGIREELDEFSIDDFIEDKNNY
ncbi:MAG: hypothetical protein FD178_1527 [Ignavibacteria bacterium]|nr:MAG: hypothetical protein FD178_1527 [Ignavibacteria bacterium]